MGNKINDPIARLMGLRYKSHPWHGVSLGDNVPEEVYRNLISTVRANLEPLHKYYSLRKKILKLDELRHYDVYTPLVSEIKCTTPYNDAVEMLRNALSPLGKEYTDVLCNGLLNGWVDRYENKGKRSGAFSAGALNSSPRTPSSIPLNIPKANAVVPVDSR